MCNSIKGFTLIELIVVIIIVSVLAIYAAPKLGNLNEDKSWSFKDVVSSKLHLVQEKNLVYDGNSCSLLVIADGNVGVAEVDDCYTSNSVVVMGTEFDNSDFSNSEIKIQDSVVKDGLMAIIGFDHLGNVRGCFVGNKSAPVTLENMECRIKIGDEAQIKISAVGAIY